MTSGTSESSTLVRFYCVLDKSHFPIFSHFISLFDLPKLSKSMENWSADNNGVLIMSVLCAWDVFGRGRKNVGFLIALGTSKKREKSDQGGPKGATQVNGETAGVGRRRQGLPGAASRVGSFDHKDHRDDGGR